MTFNVFWRQLEMKICSFKLTDMNLTWRHWRRLTPRVRSVKVYRPAIALIHVPRLIKNLKVSSKVISMTLSKLISIKMQIDGRQERSHLRKAESCSRFGPGMQLRLGRKTRYYQTILSWNRCWNRRRRKNEAFCPISWVWDMLDTNEMRGTHLIHSDWKRDRKTWKNGNSISSKGGKLKANEKENKNRNSAKLRMKKINGYCLGKSNIYYMLQYFSHQIYCTVHLMFTLWVKLYIAGPTLAFLNRSFGG